MLSIQTLLIERSCCLSDEFFWYPEYVLFRYCTSMISSVKYLATTRCGCYIRGWYSHFFSNRTSTVTIGPCFWTNRIILTKFRWETNLNMKSHQNNKVSVKHHMIQGGKVRRIKICLSQLFGSDGSSKSLTGMWETKCWQWHAQVMYSTAQCPQVICPTCQKAVRVFRSAGPVVVVFEVSGWHIVEHNRSWCKNTANRWNANGLFAPRRRGGFHWLRYLLAEPCQLRCDRPNDSESGE